MRVGQFSEQNSDFPDENRLKTLRKLWNFEVLQIFNKNTFLTHFRMNYATLSELMMSYALEQPEFAFILYTNAQKFHILAMRMLDLLINYSAWK